MTPDTCTRETQASQNLPYSERHLPCWRWEQREQTQVSFIKAQPWSGSVTFGPAIRITPSHLGSPALAPVSSFVSQYTVARISLLCCTTRHSRHSPASPSFVVSQYTAVVRISLICGIAMHSHSGRRTRSKDYITGFVEQASEAGHGAINTPWPEVTVARRLGVSTKRYRPFAAPSHDN